METARVRDRHTHIEKERERRERERERERALEKRRKISFFSHMRAQKTAEFEVHTPTHFPCTDCRRRSLLPLQQHCHLIHADLLGKATQPDFRSCRVSAHDTQAQPFATRAACAAMVSLSPAAPVLVSDGTRCVGSDDVYRLGMQGQA